MKNFISAIVFSIVTLTFFNCRSSFITKNSDKWKKHELRPSQISYSGDVFFTSELDDGISFEVFWDKVAEDDGKFYYNILMDDFGWNKNSEGNWSARDSYTVRRVKSGYIYVNPVRKAAIYFNPSTDKYNAFKVRLNIPIKKTKKNKSDRLD